MKKLEYIIEQALSKIIAEAPARETDNAPSDSVESPFTPAEEKFLGKFDAYGTTHLGIIYSPSDIGIREFIGRSGAELNISPGILLNLLRNKVIKIVPYTGYGRNTDYTLELQLSLDDVAGLGDEDKKEIEAGKDAGGAAPGMPGEELPAPEPGPEVAWVIPYGELIKESTLIAKQLITEKASDKKKSAAKIHVDKSRVLKRLPKSYINQLERIIDMMGKRAHTAHEKQRIIADILDNLAINLDLTDKQIKKSYEFFKNQKRLQESFEAAEEPEFVYESVAHVLSEVVSPQRAYLEKQGLEKYILNAGNFWNEIPGVFDGWGMNWNETLFFDTFKKYVWGAKGVSDKRKQAIVIDAVGLILHKIKFSAPNSTAYAMFLNDWITSYDTMEFPVNIPYSSDDVAAIQLGGFLGQFDINTDIFDESAETKQLVNGLNFNRIGRLVLTAKADNWYPTYGRKDVTNMVGALLAPYRAKTVKDKKGREQIDPALGSRYKKVALGKTALAQIIKKINALYPNAQVKWNGSSNGRPWVDSKGAGVYIIPPAGAGSKLVIWPDGTVKEYEKNGNFVSTFKLTNKTVKYENNTWFLGNHMIGF